MQNMPLTKGILKLQYKKEKQAYHRKYPGIKPKAEKLVMGIENIIWSCVNSKFYISFITKIHIPVDQRIFLVTNSNPKKRMVSYNPKCLFCIACPDGNIIYPLLIIGLQSLQVYNCCCRYKNK